MPSLFPTIVLVSLALLWGWVLIRPALQNMMNGARRDPVGHFNRHLSVLGQTPERARSISAGSWQYQPARKRRLQFFLGLVFAAVVSLALALTLRGIFVWQHLLLDTALLGFLVVAARAGANEAVRTQKVSYLGSSASTSRPTGQARAAGDR